MNHAASPVFITPSKWKIGHFKGFWKQNYVSVCPGLSIQNNRKVPRVIPNWEIHRRVIAVDLVDIFCRFSLSLSQLSTNQ